MDLIKVIHNVGSATNRDIQTKLWFGLIQDFVDLSEGRVKLKILSEFIENIADQSLKPQTPPMNIEDGKRTLKELLADESLIILQGRKGKEIINISVLNKLKERIEGNIKDSKISESHEYYDLCIGGESYVIFPTQQQLNTLLQVHSNIACRICKSTKVICILTAAEYLDNSTPIPSNLTIKIIEKADQK